MSLLFESRCPLREIWRVVNRRVEQKLGLFDLAVESEVHGETIAISRPRELSSAAS